MNESLPTLRNTGMLPVLMYHGLHGSRQARGRYDDIYSVHPDTFARQLDWLLDSGHRTVGLAETAATGPSFDRRVAITFDDGDVSNIEVALPLLRERGMTASFFITSDFIDTAGMLGRADVRTLAKAGMGIGAHGRSHAFLEDLDIDTLDAELRESRALLSALSGRRVDALALPGGRGGERERRAALALGYRHLFGSVPGPNRGVDPDSWMQRIAVTRHTTPAAFAALVQWHGLAPRMARARFVALSWPKRLLGNAGYARLRGRLT